MDLEGSFRDFKKLSDVVETVINAYLIMTGH